MRARAAQYRASVSTRTLTEEDLARYLGTLDGADALLIVTEWNEFREPDFARMRALMRSPTVFDGRNLFTPERMRAAGFTYVSIGR